jgi:site-specific recombinase XerD
MTDNKSISPLRARMLDDMRMRHLSPSTQHNYVRAVEDLARFLRRSPDTATAEDLRNFQLHLVDLGATPGMLNSRLTGLKFFFRTTVAKPELLALMSPVREPVRLPVVLTREEVTELLACAPNVPTPTLSLSSERPETVRAKSAKSRLFRSARLRELFFFSDYQYGAVRMPNDVSRIWPQKIIPNAR